MSRRSHQRAGRGFRPERPQPRLPAARGPVAADPPPTVTPEAPLATHLVRPPVTDGAAPQAASVPMASAAVPVAAPSHPVADAPGTTAAQLRRFIKSRPWVPMHELRRRFGINGTEDDVSPVPLAGTTVYVGLPAREGQLLGELLRAGDIGYELSLDPCTPIVIGVYPMRPVPRP